MHRRFSLILLPLLLGGCYPPYVPPPPAAVAVPAIPVVTPPAQSIQAAVAIEKKASDAELKVQDIGLHIYQRVVESTRQGKVSQAAFSKFQKAYDLFVSQVHSYAVLSPLGGLPAENAREGVAKALTEMLVQAQQLKVL